LLDNKLLLLRNLAEVQNAAQTVVSKDEAKRALEQSTAIIVNQLLDFAQEQEEKRKKFFLV